MPRKRVVAVVGAGRDVEPAVSNARELGRLIALNEWILITGGRDVGVMKAANVGAKEIDTSLTIGILPNSATKPADAVDVAIVTDSGQARNNIIVLSADVVIACGVDGAGTASEISLALKNGKPVILLDPSPAANQFFQEIGGGRVRTVSTSAEAVGIAKDLIGYQ